MEIESSLTTFQIGAPELAAEFLKRLFALSFRTTDQGVIYLPGQYASKPSIDVLAESQNGLTLTFIQHGKTRTLAKEPTVVQCDGDGDGKKMIPIEFKACSWFKHQDGWNSLIDSKGRLTTKSVEVIGTPVPVPLFATWRSLHPQKLKTRLSGHSRFTLRSSVASFSL